MPAAKVRDVAHMLKAIHAQESREAAEQKARMIIEELKARKMSKAAELVEQAVNETLTYYAFPDIHWQKIRTNNPLERIMRRIGAERVWSAAFPDGQSCLNLAAVHRSIGLVDEALHEHATPPPIAGHANRSRRLIQCAKDFGHYLTNRCLAQNSTVHWANPSHFFRSSSCVALSIDHDLNCLRKL